MTRYKRMYYRDAVYHIIARGNNRQMILEHGEDKTSLLETLSRYKNRFNFKIYAFVFMDNHFHFIIQAGPLHNISKIMQSILLSYSNKYRHKYGYSGHVWQGRFISNVITNETQLINNIKYIHNNPVRAQIVQIATDYSWSSARLYAGIATPMIESYLKIDWFEEHPVI